LEVAKRIAYIVWQTRYQDDELYLKRNDSVSVEHPDSINFFYGQFDWENQLLYDTIVHSLPESEIKKELEDFITNYHLEIKKSYPQ
jgi:hypothetical protein